MYQIASLRCGEYQISLLVFMLTHRAYDNEWKQQLVRTSAHGTHFCLGYTGMYLNGF